MSALTASAPSIKSLYAAAGAWCVFANIENALRPEASAALQGLKHAQPGTDRGEDPGAS